MTDVIPVDIIMGTYNGARFLQAQIDSLFAQTHRNWRLLVRDDGSTDSTIALLKSASDTDTRVHLVTDGLGNLGVDRNFRHLLTLSTAPFVMYCDQDDIWLPKKIELTLGEMFKFVTGGSNVPALVHCDAMVTDSELKVVQSRFVGSRAKLTGLSAMLFANCVQGAAAMINAPLRERLLRVKPLLPYDYLSGVIAASTGERRFLDQALLLYRQHSCNTIGVGGSNLPRQNPKVAVTLQWAIDAFPRIRETLGTFRSEISPEIIKELDDCSVLLFGENTAKRLLIALRRRYGFYRRRDRLNLLLYICLTGSI